MQQIYDIYNIGRKTNRINTAPYGAMAKNVSEIAKTRQEKLKYFRFLQSKGLNVNDII